MAKAQTLVERLRSHKWPILNEAAARIEELESLQREPPHCATCHCEPLPHQMLQEQACEFK